MIDCQILCALHSRLLLDGVCTPQVIIDGAQRLEWLIGHFAHYYIIITGMPDEGYCP